MGQKWTKMTIKWLKMVQLTPNLAIFCICGTFMNFKNFGKIGPFLGDFWPKNRVFYAKSAKIKKRKVNVKFAKSPSILTEMVQFFL